MKKMCPQMPLFHLLGYRFAKEFMLLINGLRNNWKEMFPVQNNAFHKVQNTTSLTYYICKNYE